MQQEQSNNAQQRRATDAHRNEPTLYDIWTKLGEIEQRQINNATAFLVNDLGKPDYDGHRVAHRGMVRSAEALDGYKVDATKRVVGVVIGVICTLLALGVVNWLQGSMK